METVVEMQFTKGEILELKTAAKNLHEGLVD